MSNNPTSKQFTFLQLLSNNPNICNHCGNLEWQEIKKIEIPIIQRDYAQGRKGKEELRKNFLSALYQAIDKNTKLELDFVYGSVKDSVLQPLDGQQRLTTLFLLHWFIAVKENKLDEDLKKLLTKFTYETRTSSREFCLELINKGINYNIEGNISDVIIDSSWFFLSWKKDPTIKSMLIMLDAIQETFKDSTDFWDKLGNISFHFIELQNFGLSDDLYIKMNARGKALTEFENFKAKFEQHIKQIIYKKDENGKELLDNGKKIILKDNWEKDLNAKDTFTEKIDTTWTELFWKVKNDKNVFDEQILKFMAGIAIFQYTQNQEIYHDEQEIESTKIELLVKDKSKAVSDEALKRERIERRIAKLSDDFNKLRPNDYNTKEAFEDLKNCFDLYSGEENKYKIKPTIALWSYCEEKDETLFSKFIKSPNYKQLVLFYAQTQYLKNINDLNQENLNDWMRVVRNIVENSTIDSAGTLMGAINLIKELSNGCSSIYEYLSEKDKILSNFADLQVKEEIEKALIIKENKEIKKIIHNVEDTNFCKGRIKFVLYCCEKNLNSIKDVLEVIDNNFNRLNAKLSDEFKRAFLTIEQNNYYEIWGSWSYSFNCKKRWLLGTVNDLKNFTYSLDWKSDYLKKLFVNLIQYKDFSTIIKNYNIPSNLPKWKERLIKEENLLNGATYIMIPNEDTYCLLAWQKKPTNDSQIKKIE